MPEAKIEKDYIVVEGAGLKLKHSLQQALTPFELMYSGRARKLVFLSKYGHLCYDVFRQFSCQLSEDLRIELDSTRKRYEKHLMARDQVIQIQEQCKAETGSSHWDNILKWYQGVEINCMTVDNLLGMCLFDEQGTGKTLSAIAAFDIIKDRKIADILFVVGLKSVLGSWKEHFDKFLPGKYSISLLEGTKEEKFRKLQRSSDIYLINYESVAPLLTFMISIARDSNTMLVVDESYLVKNPDAQRSAAIRQLRSYCRKAFVLCGTPAPNKPDDITHQFDIADDGYTFSGFKLTRNPEHDRSEILKRIDQRGIFVRNLKPDVLPDLPKKRFRIHRVDMVGKQQLLYEQARSDLILYLRNLDNSTFRRNLVTYFQRRAVLLQLCVSPKMIDKTYDETPAKYLHLDNLVRSIVRDGKRKIVIWSYYTQSLDELELRYKEHGVVRVDGTVATAFHRADLIHGFQTDPSLNIFVGNPAAAGAGITLHAASECVYISFSNQAAHFLQSLDRIHRIGQEASQVEYHFVICRNSIEIGELHRLSGKEIMQGTLLGDSITEEPTLEAALAELQR